MNRLHTLAVISVILSIVAAFPASAQVRLHEVQNTYRYPRCIGYDHKTWKNPRVCWVSCLAKSGNVSVCYCECMYGSQKRLRR